jgi:Domain of unknown function (DUF6371)
MERAVMDEGRDPFAPLTGEERATAAPASTPDGQLVVPVPEDAPPPPLRHKRLGEPVGSWAYCNAVGETVCYIARYNKADGGKEFLPYTLWRRPNRRPAWRCKNLQEPRPLYGLELLAARPHAHVIVVEGEKAADAARSIFPDHVVVSAMGGAKAANKTDWDPLRGRTVVIWPDNDAPGVGFSRTIGAILCGLNCAVSIVDSAALAQLAVDVHGTHVDPEGWDVADAIKLWDDTQTLREAALGFAGPFRTARGEALDHVEKKPRLKIEEGHPERTVAELRDILSKSGRLYDRGAPVRVVHDQYLGGSVAHAMTADSLTLEAHIASQPYKISNTGDKRDATLPPLIARMYLNWKGEWRLPPLNGITTAPLLSEDGSIRTACGYDAATGLWCERVPDVASLVPAKPTIDQAAATLMVVRDAFKTLCFADANTVVFDGVTTVDLGQPPGMDESSFLVSLLGAVCRASLWLAPGSLIRAAQTSGSGAGKGKLARCVCVVAYGRQPSAVTAGGSSEEFEKRISAALLEGGPVVLLDNCNNMTLRSASLDSALTERPSKVRQFRTLELVAINTVASVFVTGNGVVLAQDTVRRFIPTELDARMEDPERRSFPGDILTDVTFNRSTILAALLTIWRYGRLAAGIERGIVLGSYEQWCAWARDPLLSLGCRDPVERLRETKTRDPMRQMIGDLFAVWWKHHGSSPQTAHGLDLEGQKIVDPHGRGRQYVAAQLEKLAGTRVAGFVLSRQAPVGMWGAATYALSKNITEEANGERSLKNEPKPYAPYDAYGFRAGSNEEASPLEARNTAHGAQDDQRLHTEREIIGIIGGIERRYQSSTPSAETQAIVAPPSAASAAETVSDKAPANPPRWTREL